MTFLEALKRIGIMLGGAVALLLVVAGLQLGVGRRVPDWLGASLVLGGVFAVYYLYVRLTERRRVAELDVRPLAPELSGGLLIGAVLFCAVMVLLALTGHYSYTGYAVSRGLVSAFILAFAGATFEELLFRGFLFRVVQGIGGTWIAVAVSAAVFGALHGFNPHATAASSLAIALEAGVLLALAYAATQRLWLPLGIHTAWNFTEGPIFGVAVSGTHPVPGILRGTVSGPDIITGGAFGVEASVLAVIVCGIAAALIAVYCIRAGRVVPIGGAGRAPSSER